MLNNILRFAGFSFLWATQSLAGPQFTPDYYKDIKPIFDSRCIQCHACFNSPCQLKFTSPDGIRRGLIQNFNVYDTTRVRAYSPTRLNKDVMTAQEWHSGAWYKPLNTNWDSFLDRESPLTKHFEKNIGSYLSPQQIEKSQKALINQLLVRFHPVIPVGDRSQDLITPLIEERVKNPSAVDDLTFFAQLQPENSRVCAKNEVELKEHIHSRAHDFNSSAGMPYGLPALSSKEINTLKKWIQAGAPLPEEGLYEVSHLKAVKKDLKKIKAVEAFMNRPGKKARLVSRYIFEHLFMAHLYLDKTNSSGQFYEIIRTYEKCDALKKIKPLATRRPWGTPGDRVSAIHYCLRPHEETITHKNHVTYLFDQEKINRLDQLFYKSISYDVNVLPSRTDEIASNPFKAFESIPVKLRYQFLLDDSKYFVRSFIRGPVCKSNAATNSIDEQFYVLFLDPAVDPLVMDKNLEEIAKKTLDLPAKNGSEQIGFAIEFGKDIHKQRDAYLEARDKSVKKYLANGYGVEDLWNGQGLQDYKVPNKNTNLTVFRNYESAAVVQGLIGPTSKTLFVLDYAILERLYYLLVSGYDVFADFNHHLHSRIYMAYLRMEAENLFLNFLPQEIRQPLRDSWYIPGIGPTEMALKDKVNDIYPLRGQNLPSRDKYRRIDSKLLQAKIEQAKHPHIKSYNRLNMGIGVSYVSSAKEQLDLVLYDYKSQFMLKAKRHLGKSLAYKDTINSETNRFGSIPVLKTAISEVKKSINNFLEFEQELRKIVAKPAKLAPWVLKMPSLSYVLIKGKSQSQIYTLVRQKEHFNIAWIAGEEGRRNHNEDSIYVYKGVLGSYPNMIFSMDLSQTSGFLNKIQKLGDQDHSAYEAFIAVYGSPRNGPGSEHFWNNYDNLHQEFKKSQPIEFGYLDLNRYGLDYRYADDNSPMKYAKQRACFEKFNLILAGEGGISTDMQSTWKTLSDSFQDCF